MTLQRQESTHKLGMLKESRDHIIYNENMSFPVILHWLSIQEATFLHFTQILSYPQIFVHFPPKLCVSLTLHLHVLFIITFFKAYHLVGNLVFYQQLSSIKSNFSLGSSLADLRGVASGHFQGSTLFLATSQASSDMRDL